MVIRLNTFSATVSSTPKSELDENSRIASSLSLPPYVWAAAGGGTVLVIVGIVTCVWRLRKVRKKMEAMAFLNQSIITNNTTNNQTSTWVNQPTTILTVSGFISPSKINTNSVITDPISRRQSELNSPSSQYDAETFWSASSK